jgi:AcrR family transcriptional regulator
MRKTDRSAARGSATRERILDVACRLLNERGIERVTTRLIADTAGINEGNLYYYFRTKEALCLALLTRLEAQALQLVAAPPRAEPALVPYGAMLREWFLLTWSYRFLFRDMAALGTTAPTLRRRLRRFSARLQHKTQTLLQGMRSAGLLVIDDAALQRLLANLWIVGSYWMNYLVLQHGLRVIKPEHLIWGLQQTRALYEPYLSEGARRQLAEFLLREPPLLPV